MKFSRLILTGRLVASLITMLTAPAKAYNIGETVYLCRKNQKSLWVVEEDSWRACLVRVLSRSGGRHRVLATSKSCLEPGFGTDLLSRGQEIWVEGYNLWPSRSLCGCQGARKKKTSRKKSYQITLKNDCKESMSSFVRYKNFSGNSVNTTWFRLPNDGKRYNAMDAKSKNKIICYYVEKKVLRTGSSQKGKDVTVPLTYTNRNSINRSKDGKSYKMWEFKSSSAPAGIVFC